VPTKRGISATLGCLLVLAGALLFAAPASASQVYVTGSTGNAISPFSIGSGGGLTPISCGPSCNSGSQPIGVAISPNGQYLYAANHGANRVAPYTINTGGSLGAISCPGSTCNTGTNPYGMAVSPNGQYVYAANLGSNRVSGFTIGSGGALTPISCGGSNCNTGSEPYGVAVSPNGQFLYTANRLSNTVSAFTIGSGGALTPISCGASCNTGTQPQAISVHPNGQYLYVANRGTARVSVYSIAGNGSLTPITCTTNCNTGAAPMSMAIRGDGQYLYTVNRTAQTVSAFSIGGGGTLTPVSCPGSNCNTGPIPGGIAVNPNGQSLYVSNFGNNTVSPYSIGGGGSLTPISCTSPNCNTASGPDFMSVAVSPVQSPTAAFSAHVVVPGVSMGFDGSDSAAAAEQSVARYDWDFGDGQTAPNGGPTPTHTYSAEGDYTVTLTVTDNAGCSNTQTYTGQTASCNGTTAARITQTVSVGDPPTTVIDSKPPHVTDNPLPVFTFHATEPGSTFECSIDTGNPTFGPCSGPGARHTPPSPLGLGFYAFRVRATDPFGNTGPAAISTFRVDTVPDPPACRAVAVSASRSGSAESAGAAQGPLGVRARISVDEPAQLEIKPTLTWKRHGRLRTKRLATRDLSNPGVRDLELTRPESLARKLPRGSRVKLRLKVTAHPDSSPGCEDPTVKQLSLRTRVVRLPAG